MAIFIVVVVVAGGGGDGGSGKPNRIAAARGDKVAVIVAVSVVKMSRLDQFNLTGRRVKHSWTGADLVLQAVAAAPNNEDDKQQRENEAASDNNSRYDDSKWRRRRLGAGGECCCGGGEAENKIRKKVSITTATDI